MPTHDILMSAAGVSVSESYWLTQLSGSSSFTLNGVTTDSNDNVYITGNGLSKFLIAKYNKTGALEWKKILNRAQNGDVGRRITIDSSGNVYACGYLYGAAASYYYNDMYLMKLNSSGALQWQRVLYDAGNNVFHGVDTDSAGNVYVCGTTFPSNNAYCRIVLAKYDSSGTLQWQKFLSSSGTYYVEGKDIVIDSSDNIYIGGSSYVPGEANYNRGFVAKYNTSGTLQWQKIITSGTRSVNGEAIDVDSSGNVYVGGYYSTAIRNTDGWIAKIDSSGSLLWSTYIDRQETATYGYDLTVDSTGNAYICGYSYSGGSTNNDWIIGKFDTDGSAQWSRRVRQSGSTYEDAYGITVDSKDSVCICGYAQISINTGLMLKVPNDGSKTGTYNGIIYEDSSATMGNASLSISDSYLSASDGNLSTYTPTDTLADVTATSTTTPM